MNRFLVALALGACAGCFKPPDVVMVNRATALEEQAAGSFDDTERRLQRSAIEPRPIPLTPEQLEALGIKSGPKVDAVERTDADRVDELLVQHCLGEGADGLLVETHDACQGAADVDEVTGVVDRVNRARRQVWKWMHELRTDISADDLRKRWHEAHVLGVVCGGWLQGPDGKWQGKGC